jgi:hypothetical protein
MVKGGGRHMVSTLVIFKNDNTIHRLSLENMGTTNDKLLKYIALYGKKRPHNI